METESILLTFFLFFIIATLYSSVGHAGASGYLAIMALLSFSPESIKPTSLLLNIIVACIASVKFIRAGYFDKKIFFSFVITSLPMSYLGGSLSLNPLYFKLFAGVFLILSAILLFVKIYIKPLRSEQTEMNPVYGLVLGAGIGLLSGLIGVGGGIFLSPILIMCNWCDFKKTSGISALFILLNSMAALAGHISVFKEIDAEIFYWIPAVCIGGLLGSYLGSIQLNSKLISLLLFFVLITAGLKFIVIDFL